jgi:DNA modification methylase
MNDYAEFLAGKRPQVAPAGFEVGRKAIKRALYPFQRDIVRWALRLGRAAVFADVGLGKTAVQVEWARLVRNRSGRPVLILTALAVAPQTIRFAKDVLDIDVIAADDDGTVLHHAIENTEPGIFITNYERVHLFDFGQFGGVVLDESSILKHYTKTFFELVELCKATPFLLCCTATPAPNDYVEFGNHSTFLGIMHFKDMLARFFVGEGDLARAARLKGHARSIFWQWLTSWAVCISKPSDLGDGYHMDGYDLPPLHIHELTVAASEEALRRAWSKGKLFPDASSATEMWRVKRATISERVQKAVEIAHGIWSETACGSLNTPNAGAQNTNPIPTNASGGGNKGATPRKIGSTCEPTTNSIATAGTTIATLASETPGGANNTSPTLSTVKSAKRRRGGVINLPNGTDGSKPTSGLTPTPTMPSLPCKAAAAPSVEPQQETEQGDGFTSITATVAALSEGFSALPATSASASSATIPNSSDGQRDTSKSLEPIVVWCETNEEQAALETAFGDKAFSIYGSLSAKVKESRLVAWLNGERPILISKPEICGWGINMQHCAHMIFVGLSFSFERWYQAIGRVYRFGQTREVHIYMVSSETEESVASILNAKRQAFAEMQAEMNAAMREHGLFREGSVSTVYQPSKFELAEGRGWRFWNGDCIEVMPTIPADSVGLTVTSIPFSNLYIYSDSDADVGNAADKREFFEHMAFVIRELYRITMPGRCCAVHVKDLPLFQNRDGVMGIDPFSDDTVRAFLAEGWVLQSRVTVEKDPVVEMQKTNSHGLLFKNWKQRAEVLRVGLPDYVLVFVKPGECPQPVRHDPRDLTYFGAKPIEGWRFPSLPSRKTGEVNEALPIWQRYANPNWDDVVVPLVWSDINQTDVLNYILAKAEKDERHLCPLQLDLIARVIHWKSNRGDVVFDPFGGVGSTPYKAVELGRVGWGVELKDSYWRHGVRFMQAIEAEVARPTLFDMLPDGEAVR